MLRGGGEMGALIRRFDWAATPLGAVHTWPATLRRGLLPENAAFLQKPFTRDDLVLALNSVLMGSAVVGG